MKLSGNTFLVTGGASGLGEATVRNFASAGANVVIADLNEAQGQALARELGGKTLFQKTDVTSPESAQASVDAARNKCGGLHGLINCAGILAGSRIVGRDGPHDLALFSKVVQV